MPKHPKRPRDPAQLAKLVVDIATGSAHDVVPKDGGVLSTAGLKGGRARAESLSADKRRKIAKAAALARWRDDKHKRHS